MIIKVYSKENCDKCKSAKEKLDRMGLEFEEHSAEYHGELNDGWRDNGSVGFKAESVKLEGQLPVIEIDGQCRGYSEAMLILKEMR